MMKLDLPSQVAGPAKMLSASAFFNDRFAPAPEVVLLPPETVPPGNLQAELARGAVLETSKVSAGAKQLLRKLRTLAPETGAPGQVYCDFRHHSPENWAHSLNLYLPLACFLRNEFEEQLRGRPLCVVLPANTPTYIQRLYQLFEFPLHLTDRRVKCDALVLQLSSFGSLRTVSRKWVLDYMSPGRAYQSLLLPGPDQPSRLYISRRDTRKVSNEDEIEALLLPRGFRKVYPEDLSAAEQLKLFMHATQIVGIHGAGLAPLLYRPTSQPPLGLVELLNPGHMSKYYRVMSDQVGAHWVGVRGRIEARHAGQAYEFDQAYQMHSLSDFWVDVDALRLALDMMVE